MRNVLMMLAMVACLAGAIRAQEPVVVNDRFDPKAGDTIVFLGDSITHQCFYTQYIEDYFYTRYPAMKLHFYNAGVSGDVAADALRRFDSDVTEQKPAWVTILLGMNDGRYQQWDNDIFEQYKRDMNTIMDKLEALGATIIPMKPTMYDIVAYHDRKPGQWKHPKDPAGAAVYNMVMAYYGAWLQQAAMDRGRGVIDVYSPLNEFTVAGRKSDPHYTLVPDAVHPGPPGHAIMAFTLLETSHGNRKVSAVKAVRRGDQWKIDSADGEIADVSGDPSHVKFTFTAKSLPWVLPEETELGFTLTHAGHKMSNERLTVAGLAPGKYQLSIDGQVVGAYSNLALGSKVELQSNKKTPQYQQALAVAMLNKERNDKAIHPLRNLYSRLKGQRRNGEPDAAWMENFKAEAKKLTDLADEYEAKIYELAQPKPRVYELRPFENRKPEKQENRK
ncbi:SGNH/GDSL hydrolase family protein [Planctomycetales bacterium ZRK34]|nr:SGNH/GDSL hydrolase family protein [Planctomycetales bacterium ZRK34]